MDGKMMVQTFYEPNVMKYEQRDIPKIADNEVLVKVKAVGICGSDISYYYGHSPVDTPDGKGPLILGHEASGVIAEVGSTAKKLGLFEAGDRVAINPVQQCNACPECMRGEFNVCSHVETIGVSVDGCFAEYVKVKYTHAYKIPDDVSFETAALAEPLACAVHAVQRLNVQLGQTVVTYGTGGIGLMQVQLAKAAGAGKVISVGRKDYGLEKALECGAYRVVNNTDQNSPYYASDVAGKVAELNEGAAAQRAIVATSNMEALQDAIDVTGACSTIVYFGLPGPQDELKVPVLNAIQSERTLKFSWLAPLCWDNVFAVMSSGQVNLAPIITNRFTLEDAEKGIKYMKESPDNKIKGVIILD